MIERERKFKFKGDIEDLKDLFQKRYRIEQAYLINREKYELRIRRTIECSVYWRDDLKSERYLLTFKYDTFNKEVRYEIEFPIPKFLGNLLIMDKKSIIKNRSEIKLFHHARVFVDEYINPLIEPVVEIEFFGKGEKINLPKFCGEEITGHYDYKNKNIYKTL